MLKDDILSCFDGMSAKVSIVLKDLLKEEAVLELDAARVVPSASTIKILIMIEALKQVMESRLSLEEMVFIKPSEKVDFSIISELDVACYSIRDLITLMIIISDNTATNVLIDILGYDNINAQAERMQLKGTALNRKMMDFEAARQGRQNLTTVRDMAYMMEALYEGRILDRNMCDLALNILKRQKHKDLLKRYIAEDIVVAHKSGDLENLNHDIGIFYLPDAVYLLGVFVTEAESNVLAKHIIGKVSETVYEHFCAKI